MGCTAYGASAGGQIKDTWFVAAELPYVHQSGRWVIHGMLIEVGGICHADGSPIALGQHVPAVNPPPVALSQLEPVAKAMRAVGELVEGREHIARALFASDEQLLQFVERVADALIGDGEVDGDRTRSALTKAWERDELGKRTASLERALIVQAIVHGECIDHYRWTAGLEMVYPRATHARARDVAETRESPRPPHTSEAAELRGGGDHG